MDTADTFPPALAMARYRLHCVVEAPLEFNDFAGSALRGAFGHALKNLVCITRMENCSDCAFQRTCSYTAVFEPPPPAEARAPRHVPPPYLIEPPAPGPISLARGEIFEFGLVLVGTALTHLPLVIRAWQAALARSIGRHGRLSLSRVDDEHGQLVLGLPANRLHEHGQMVALPAPPPDLTEAIVDFTTPFSLSRSGRTVAPAELHPADLLMALVRRIATLSEHYWGGRMAINFTALNKAAQTVQGRAQWRQLQWRRYSSRQRRPIPLEGSVGQWHLHGNLTPFWPYLYLGQWLHVGKKSSLGFGNYRLRLPSQDCH